MYSLLRILCKFFAGGRSCEAENGDESPKPPSKSAVRTIASWPVLHKPSASTDSPSSESSALGVKPATSSKASVEADLSLKLTWTFAAPSNVPKQLGKGMSVQVEKGKTNVCAITKVNEDLIKKENVTLSPSTSKLPQTQSVVRPTASSPVFHRLPTSTKSTPQNLPHSESSISAPKPATSSKASLEETLLLNPTLTPAASPNVAIQQGKGIYVQVEGIYVQVEKNKTHVCAVPKANEYLIKKENVPLSPSTSKLPTQSALKPTTSSKASAESALSLNPTLTPAGQSNVTKQQGKAMYVCVEKGKTHIRAIPKANEDLIRKETVPLSPSTSKLPLPFPNATTSSPKHASASDEASSSKLKPVYSIPEAIEYMIKNDMVPDIVSKPLSSSTYKDYFAALLYAEDYYIEKWNGFTLVNVSVELHTAEIVKRSSKDKHSHQNHKKENKLFVAFEIDSVPERRPFLLSRDFVFARPSGEQRDPFKGFVNRVKESTLVLVEFGEDFHSQHHSLRRYDVSFSFNRVCLKRAHHAIAAASDLLFQSFIFPDYISRQNTPTWPANWCSHKLSAEQKSAVHHILSSGGAPPYLVEGPLCASWIASYDSNAPQLSETGVIVKEAVVQILRSSSTRRVLICARINKTCDVLMRSLKNEIPNWVMFRANAAFREIDGVPIDILDLSQYEGECFTCPSLDELKKYRVILSTFVSSFRLHYEGIPADHFSHIFLVDATSASEPETMVALSNFATENTTVVVTGAPGNSSRWIRSDIARKHGLRLSYFQRLAQSKQYINLDPMFITKLGC